MVLDSLPYRPATRGLVMGALVGLVGLYMPETLTWGEFQIDILTKARTPLGVGDSTALAVAKYCAILVTVSSGYGAGIVYPLVMVGYCFGPLLAAALQPRALDSYCTASSFVSTTSRDVGVELVSQVTVGGARPAIIASALSVAVLFASLLCVAVTSQILPCPC
jgi:H+/Cl- antiporter ClcA